MQFARVIARAVRPLQQHVLVQHVEIVERVAGAEAARKRDARAAVALAARRTQHVLLRIDDRLLLHRRPAILDDAIAATQRADVHVASLMLRRTITPTSVVIVASSDRIVEKLKVFLNSISRTLKSNPTYRLPSRIR